MLFALGSCSFRLRHDLRGGGTTRRTQAVGLALVVALAASLVGCPDSHPAPTSCTSSRECSAAGLVCDTVSSTCVECLGDFDCLFADTVCRAHACVTVTPCTTSRECPGLVCDRSLGYCVECITDTDCPDETVCSSSTCVAPPMMCDSDRDCSAMGLVCDVDARVCVECVRHADCSASETCVGHRCLVTTVDAGPPTYDAGPPPATEDLDLLLMVDNSNSMAGEQALLTVELPRLVRTLGTGDRDGDGVADFTPVGSLHVGIVTSDLGAGPNPLPGGDGVVPSCDPGLGDDGILQTLGHSRPGCSATYPPVFDFEAGSDDPIAFAEDVACVAATGTGGCGFEQQLEAVLKALSPASATAPFVAPGYVPPIFAAETFGHGDGVNAGFLRASSVLAVLLATDEEDCSVPDYSIFYNDARFVEVPLNLRCFTYADPWLYPTSRYVAGLAALRVYPSRLVYAAIVGVPTDLGGSSVAEYEAALADPRMIETPDPAASPPIRLLSSCTTADGGGAYPPRRIVEVASGLSARGAHTTIQSICAADFAPAIGAIVDEMALALSGR